MKFLRIARLVGGLCLAGCVSLGCMAASLVVIGRILGPGPYLIWGVLSLPGVLYLLAGWKLRGTKRLAWASGESGGRIV